MARAPRVVPFNPSPRDADLDQIVQEGTIWERPKGADIIYFTGRVWDQTGRAPLRSDVRIVYNGREYKPGDASRFDSSSVGARLGVIGDRVTERIAQRPLSRDSSVGESLGTLGSDPAVGRTLGESRGTLDSAPTPTPEPDFGFADSDDVGLGPELDEWGLPVLPAGTVIPDPDDVFGRDDSDADPWGGSDDFARPAGEVVESSAKESQKRRRGFWGRRKREKERQREEERVVPSMEEAVADEVEEEELDEIDAALDKVEEAIEESFEVVEAPESTSIEVLVEEDIAEIREIRANNLTLEKDTKSRIYASNSKFREKGKKDRDDRRDIDDYKWRITEVLQREQYAVRVREEISKLTGIQFLDDGTIVYPEGVREREFLNAMPRETKLAIREIIRDSLPFHEPILAEADESLSTLFAYLKVGSTFDSDTAFFRFDAEYRRKRLTDPQPSISKAELAQIAGFSSWEEAQEAAVGDKTLKRLLNLLELSADYDYNFFDDSVRGEATELGEALYKASNSNYLKANNHANGIGQNIPRNVTSEDVEVVRQQLIENVSRVIDINLISDEAREDLEERLKVIENMTPEEFETLVLDYARQVMEDPDTRIGVMISADAAQGMKRSGQYLTTHSDQTDSRSDEYDDARIAYETGMLQMPLDEDSRAVLAPSSGFLIPGARMRKARADAEEKYFKEFGVPYDPANATPEQHAFFENARISDASVGIQQYAEDVVILSPSATARSRFTDGDSFNELAMTSLMRNTDGSRLSDQQLRNAIFGRGTTTGALNTVRRNEDGVSNYNLNLGGGGSGHILGNFVAFAALGLDPADLGHAPALNREEKRIYAARKAGDTQGEITAITRRFHGRMKRGDLPGYDKAQTAGYIETMTLGGFDTSEIESASEGIRDILDVAIPAEVQQRIESYSGQFLPTSAFVEENIEQATRSALNRAAAATGTDLSETGGTAKLLTARSGELPGKFVSTFKTMEVRAGLKSRRDLLLELEADPDADPDAIAFLKNEIQILLQEAADLDKGKDIAVVAHTSSSDGWPSYLQVDHPSIVAQIHAATDKLSPEVRPERVIVSFDAPYGGGKYVHGQGGVIYIHPAALDWKDASFNINQKDLATRLAKAGATSPEEFDAFFRPSQAWVDDIIIHEGFHRVDFLLAKAGKDPQAAASLLSSPEMAAAFDEWLTTSMPFLLEYFEGVDKADLRMHEFAYLGELLGVTGTDRDEAARSKLVQLYAARVKKPVDSVDPVVAEREERWRLISEVYAELARLDAKGIPFPNSEILIDGMTPAFSRIYEGSDGSGEVLRAAFADAAASLSEIDDAVGSVQAGLDSVVRGVASDVSASVDDIDDAAEGVGLGVIRVRDGLHVHMDGYVPDPVTRDDIARQLGFADAGELDAATADDPVMANNARILEELASYGFSLERMNKISAEEWEERRSANLPRGNTISFGQGKPLDDAQLDSVFGRLMAENEEQIKTMEERIRIRPDTWDTPSQNRELAWRKDFIETYESLTFEERKQLVVDYLRNIFDDPDTTVVVDSDYIRDVFRDGINKNSHFPEVRSGSSSGGPGSVREGFEASMMGVHADSPPELRPSYGSLISGEQRRLARKLALEDLSPVRIDSDGVVRSRGVMTEEAEAEIGSIVSEVLEEFPGVQRLSDLPDADKETAVAAVTDKVFERLGLGYLTEEARLEFNDKEVGLISPGAVRGGTMMLDPKVLFRSSVSDGDSINNSGSPVPFSANMTDQDLLEIVFKKSSTPGDTKIDPTYFFAALSGSDSTVLSRNKSLNERRQEYVPTGYRFQYLETQIFGNFRSDEVIAAEIPYTTLEERKKLGIPDGLPDLTPESEVAAIKAQRAAERAGQSIDAVAADAAATIDDIDDAGDEVASFMARSFVDVVPESTEIPGGGVFETDDGGFWVSGPPPVGLTEEGKARWERGVELLRERPELFKTQVIADDGLPVPRDERPGLADIGSVYDALPSDDADAAMMVRREIEKAWQAEITRAIVLNKLDIGNPEEVWGSDNDERSEAWQRYGYAARAERGMWENLPQGLLHVTTGLSGLQDGGFKTRAQLSDESGEAPAGLGGGVDDAISFTTDPLVADSIVRGIHEMREAVRDDTGPAAVERMKSEIAAWTTSMPENERKRLLSATPSTMKERGDFYREYSYWRQYNVPNRPDPLFWSPNYQAYADLDPNEVGVVTVNPSVDGARGWQVSGMGEWRTIPEAVEIVQSEARPTIVDDMTATLDELDTVRSSAPDFGLPPGPEKLTGWDKDRLTGASVPDIHEGKPRPVTDVVDGVHLREDQKALKTVVAELSTEDDLLPLQKKLEEAFELGGSLSGKQRTDATYEIFAAINDLITSRQRDTTGFTPSQMREYEKEVAENEEWVGSRIAKAIQIHWGEARSEVFHWDFLSERVKTVLGEEFGIDVSHEPSEIDAGIEEVFEIQELLTPFIDAWVRGQYSTTQKYLEDAGITELSVFRGTYIPNVVGDDDGLPSGREPSVTRGLESWSTDIGIALGFAGNKYGTADDRIEEMAEVGELGEPTHVLQHDVVPAQLIMGIGYLDNPRIITGALGQGEESEIVVLGSSRPVNWLSNDLLKPWRSERPEGGYNFNIKEAAVFAYLSTGLWPKFS